MLSIWRCLRRNVWSYSVIHRESKAKRQKTHKMSINCTPSTKQSVTRINNTMHTRNTDWRATQENHNTCCAHIQFVGSDARKLSRQCRLKNATWRRRQRRRRKSFVLLYCVLLVVVAVVGDYFFPIQRRAQPAAAARRNGGGFMCGIVAEYPPGNVDG